MANMKVGIVKQSAESAWRRAIWAVLLALFVVVVPWESAFGAQLETPADAGTDADAAIAAQDISAVLGEPEGATDDMEFAESDGAADASDVSRLDDEKDALTGEDADETSDAGASVPVEGGAESDASQDAAAEEERDSQPETGQAIADGWTHEEGGWRYGREGQALEGWLVTDDHPMGNGLGLERYWLGEGGWLAVSRLISPDEGAEWWAYATPWGAVVRGAWDTGAGRVYVADNDGRLPDVSGWLVTGAYTDGNLERYWIESDSHAARTSIFEVDGSRYFGLGDLGYVLRGSLDTGRGRVYLADNDGSMPKAFEGWLVTGAYSGGALERYWIDAESGAAVSGFFERAGQLYFGQPGTGRVLRGKFVWGDHVLLADNDGVMPMVEGWLVTGLYDGGCLERYRIDPIDRSLPYMGARVGWFYVDGANYLGLDGVGFVLRGIRFMPNGEIVLANNDGVLVDKGSFVAKADGIPFEWGLRYFNNPTGFMMSEGAYNQLVDAMRAFWDAGQIAAFVLMDLSSGAGICWDTASTRYAASCMKAAYLTYICETQLDTGAVRLDSVGWQMEQTGVWSNNDTYASLRNRFGNAGFDAWLGASGISGYGSAWYPFTNARDLARIWAKIGAYQLSGAPYAWYCRDILSHGYYSEIYYNLGSSNMTFSKPGWINSPPSYVALNDSGIVVDSTGRAYLMTIMTNANCWGQQYKEAALVRALERIHWELPQ